MVVTSLDPCCMCTGSLVSAGFAAAISANDTFAGINYNLKATFPSVMQPAILQDTFSYPEVLGTNCFARAAQSAALPPIFTGMQISEHTQVMNLCTFQASLSAVQDTISGDVPPDPAFDIGTLPDSHPIVEALREFYPDALTCTLTTPGVPDMGLVPFITSAQHEDVLNGGNGDVACLLDYFGNLILCLPGVISASPILTPWMQVTRIYQNIKWNMINNRVPDAEKYLLHPKYGVILFLRAPNGSFRDLVDLGAYGSTMEGKLPDVGWPNFQYIQPSTLADLQAYLDGLPPFYSSLVQMKLTQVTNPDLPGAFPTVPPPSL